MNAFDRHKKFINDYVLRFKHGTEDYLPSTANYKTDEDILRDNYKFIRTDTEEEASNNWEVRIAIKYYNKLFKEYCLADMSRFKEGKIGMRWRTQAEVFAGKGQFVCGNKKCNQKDNLKSYEVNFAYSEGGEHKNALVKLRMCPDCAYKLNYKKIKKEKKEQKNAKRQKLQTQELKESSEQTKSQEEEELTSNKVDEQHHSEEQTVENDGHTRNRATNVDSSLWKQKPEIEKTNTEEFDEYFVGLFL